MFFYRAGWIVFGCAKVSFLSHLAKSPVKTLVPQIQRARNKLVKRSSRLLQLGRWHSNSRRHTVQNFPAEGLEMNATNEKKTTKNKQNRKPHFSFPHSFNSVFSPYLFAIPFSVVSL